MEAERKKRLMKLNPKNEMDAWCNQFEDDLKILHSLAVTGFRNDFLKRLELFKVHINQCSKSVINNSKIK